MYDLPELSLREFVNYTKNTDFKAISLNDILYDHENISVEVNSKIKSVKFFREYLQTGAYPFILDGKDKYLEKVASQNVRHVGIFFDIIIR